VLLEKKERNTLETVDKEEYLEKILAKIDAEIRKNKKGLFLIGEKVSDNTAKYVKKYLEDNRDYKKIVFERCPSCTKTWDIIIWF
jgi:hypothetical protein